MSKRYIGKKLQLNNAGTTLAEMIVTFALIGMFMVAASNIMFSAMNIYYQVKGTSTGLQVTSVLEQKIVGELEGASHLTLPTNNVENINACISISDDNHKIEFFDKHGSRLSIYLDSDGYVVFHYFENDSFDSVGNPAVIPEYDWQYDKNMYMGYYVSELTFEIPDRNIYPDNVIKVNITLHSGKYGDYKTQKYIECINFEKNGENDTIIVK